MLKRSAPDTLETSPQVQQQHSSKRRLSTTSPVAPQPQPPSQQAILPAVVQPFQSHQPTQPQLPSFPSVQVHRVQRDNLQDMDAVEAGCLDASISLIEGVIPLVGFDPSQFSTAALLEQGHGGEAVDVSTTSYIHCTHETENGRRRCSCSNTGHISPTGRTNSRKRGTRCKSTPSTKQASQPKPSA